MSLCLVFMFVFGCSAVVTLRTASSYAVLAGTPSVSNTGPSLINGNVGISPGSAVTGFPPGLVVPPFVIHTADGSAAQAQLDLTQAYTEASLLLGSATAPELASVTFTPGVYTFSAAATLSGGGTVTLDFGGNSAAEFVFIIESSLITSVGSRVSVINLGGEGAPCNIFWIVGSSATIAVGSTFYGNILALTSITVDTGAVIPIGSLLARNGFVMLDTLSLMSTCATLNGNYGNE